MKENDKIGYVYLTTNLVNGKQYVGQHLHDGFDKGYKGSGTYIKRALDKYVWDNFTCEVLQWCTTQTQLNEVEDNCIRLYGTMVPNGYNLKGGGANGRYSKESRVKMSESQKQYWESEENRKKMSETKKQYYKSEENRKKMSETKKQLFESKESIKIRKKMSETKKQYYKSEENRKTIGEWSRNYYANEENRKKASERTKQFYANEENRKKASERTKLFFESESGIMLKKRYSKPVIQYTLDGEFVKKWCSLIEIQREFGFNISHISDCCKGKKKTAYKHLWKFAS